MAVIDSKSGLSPEVSEMFLKALKVDNHFTTGNISCTQLISAPKIRILRKKHRIDEELSDRLFMLLGTAFHKIMEMSSVEESDARALIQVIEFFERLNKESGEKKEQYGNVANYLKDISSQFFKQKESDFLIENNIFFELDGWTISCTLDMYHKPTKNILDYKLTKAYSWMYKEARDKYIPQMNIYAYAMRENGFEVNGAKIIGVFKDWSANEVLRNKDYPDYPIKEMPIELYPHDQIREYIRERIKLHKLAESGIDVPCTAKDRWAKSDNFAVKAVGNKRALSGGIFDSKPMAESFIKQQAHKYPKGLIVETRPGGSLFCESYCAVRNVCPQFKASVEQLSNQSQ